MRSKVPIPQNIDQYIANFPAEVQAKLESIRATIKAAAPGAEETINYHIPTFTLQGNLVHFAGYKSHIGFYPAPPAIVAFKEELSAYKTAKGSIQFPLNAPLPLELIAKMVDYRVKQNIGWAIGKPQSSLKLK